MYLAQEKLLIIKLKTLLHCNLLYICLFILLAIYVLFRISYEDNSSIYDINDNDFNMIVNNYKFDNDKLSLTLDGDEDLIGTYYIKSEEESNKINIEHMK